LRHFQASEAIEKILRNLPKEQGCQEERDFLRNSKIPKEEEEIKTISEHQLKIMREIDEDFDVRLKALKEKYSTMIIS